MLKNIVLIFIANIATSIGSYLLANHFINESLTTLVESSIQRTYSDIAKENICQNVRQLDTLTNQIRLANAKVSEQRISEIAKAILNSKYSDPELVIAIIKHESAFDPQSISSTGARGLMQIMPLWLKTCNLTNTEELYNINNNINCGIKALNHYISKYKTLKLALVAYNMGDVAIQEGMISNKYAEEVLASREAIKRIHSLE